MAVRPIDGNELYRIEKLLDTDIVRQDKVALNLLEQVLYDIQHVPTLTPPNEWVSAKDNPPQLTGKYICCVEDTHGYMWSIPADYLLEMKTWVGEFGEIKNKVVYWMPLPAPPDKDNHVPAKAPNEPLTLDPESLRPRGTWEGTADGYANGELVYDTWTCSECGYTVDTDDPDDLTKFCPNCGAKMDGGHNP